MSVQLHDSSGPRRYDDVHDKGVLVRVPGDSRFPVGRPMTCRCPGDPAAGPRSDAKPPPPRLDGLHAGYGLV